MTETIGQKRPRFRVKFIIGSHCAWIKTVKKLKVLIVVLSVDGECSGSSNTAVQNLTFSDNEI